VLVLVVLGLAHAALSRYQERRSAIFLAAKAERERLGIVSNQALGPFPTPEIQLGRANCLVPGATAEVIVKGKFKPGTSFLWKSDRLEVLKESATATEYRATLKVPADMGPESVDLEAYAPVSAFEAIYPKAVVVAGRYEWDMNVSNGWRIKARLLEDTRCSSPGGSGEMKYALEFFRGQENTPFEKRTAKLYFSPYDTRPYRFSIDEENPFGGSQAEMEELAKKFQSGSLSDAEMQKLMARLEELQKEMQVNLAKMGDPAYVKKLEEEKEQFGCQSIELQVQEFRLEGQLRCSQKVGTNLTVTGTLKFAGK
jgi:hypothetical protein